jgi:hypothetical protein
MAKVILTPIGVGLGLIAGSFAKKIFDFVWGQFSDEEAPRPDQRDVGRVQLALSLILEGAIFRVTKGAVDRATRVAWYRATGSWPGEEGPDPK